MALWSSTLTRASSSDLIDGQNPLVCLELFTQTHICPKAIKLNYLVKVASLRLVKYVFHMILSLSDHRVTQFQSQGAKNWILAGSLNAP